MTDAARETGASARATVDWFNFFRDVCAQYFLNHPIVIGGPGTVMEIKFGKRKYNRGRAVESLWRKRFCGEDLFEKLLSCISEQYPL